MPGAQQATEVWPDALLNIVRALPGRYPPPTELPPRILELVVAMEQGRAVQQQQQESSEE